MKHKKYCIPRRRLMGYEFFVYPDAYELCLTEQAEEQLQRNHPEIYKFLSRLEKASKECEYNKLRRNGDV